MAAPLHIGIVAGEASGDVLGGGLMAALKRHVPTVEFSGVGGPRMLAEGLRPRAELARLNVNGFVDPLKRLPDLLRILRGLVRHFASTPVDAVVGVDFNVFNLLMERAVKRRGIPTVHYVSPSVYAWRQGRVKRVARAADLLLALFPFEPALYAGVGVKAVFVGHPLADEIAPDAGEAPAQAAVRAALGLPSQGPIVALLPGSRLSEVERLGAVMLEAARLLETDLKPCAFVVPCVNERVAAAMRSLKAGYPQLDLHLAHGHAQPALAAADAALVKSGTATLEALLLRRPMVVTYRLGPLTYRIVKALKQPGFVALPNILSGRELVPERLQDDAEPAKLAAALLGELRRAEREADYFDEFERQRSRLRRNASEQAARAVLTLLGRQ